MENEIRTNEIWNERRVNFSKLNRKVIYLLRSRKPLEKKLVSWRNFYTDLVIDNYHQDMVLGVFVYKLAGKK